MPRYALLILGKFERMRRFSERPADIPHKGVQWLPAPESTQPKLDPSREVLEAPTYQVEPHQVSEVWTKRLKTTEEIDSAKQTAVDATPLLMQRSLRDLENDVRELRGVVNALIDALSPGGIDKFTTKATAPVDDGQFTDLLKGRL